MKEIAELFSDEMFRKLLKIEESSNMLITYTRIQNHFA